MYSLLNIPLILGVGPPRSGTTWLYKVLKNVREISLPINIKEIEYWDRKNEKGINWYLDNFNINSSNNYICDISTNYIISPEKIANALDSFDKVKIIINFRNTYDRIISMYGYYNMAGGKMNLKDFINTNTWVQSHAIMKDNVTSLINCFRKDNIHFIIFDDIADKPTILLTELCSFLNINDSTLEKFESINNKVHTTKKPRSMFVNKYAFKLQGFMRHKLQINYLPEKLKYSTLVNKLLFNYSVRNIDGKKYEDYFNHWIDLIDKDIEFIETLVSKDLSHWKSDNYFAS